jgi:hypothetical protein
MIELKNSKRTYLGRVNGRDRFALDCRIGAMQMRQPGKDWEDIDPTVKLWGRKKWGATNTPYRLEIDSAGSRRIYPDKTDLSRYIDLPAVPLFSKLKKRIGGNRIVASTQKYEIAFILTNSGVRFNALLKQPPPFDHITLDVDAVGFDLLSLLKSTSGLGIPRPRLIEADPNIVEPVQRLLDWSYAAGQLTLGFDLSGMRFPILLKNTTIDVQVGASGDDGYSNGDGGYNSNGNLMYVGAPDGGSDSWYRFPDVTISSGATIGANTYIEVYAKQNDSSGVYTNIAADDQSGPAAPTSRADHAGRTRTATIVAWDDGFWTDGGLYAWRTSPNIDGIIQELVDSYDFTAGAAIQILHDDDASPLRYASIETYDYDTTHAPKLHIEYTAAAGGLTHRSYPRVHLRGVLRGVA